MAHLLRHVVNATFPVMTPTRGKVVKSLQGESSRSLRIGDYVRRRG